MVIMEIEGDFDARSAGMVYEAILDAEKVVQETRQSARKVSCHRGRSIGESTVKHIQHPFN